MCKDVDNDKLRLYSIIFTETLNNTYLLAKQHIKKIERKNSNICLIKNRKWETKNTDDKQRTKSMCRLKLNHINNYTKFKQTKYFN